MSLNSQDLSELPRDILQDAFRTPSLGLAPDEQSAAIRVLNTMLPDENGNIPYEYAVNMLGRNNQGRAAVALLRYFGPTSAVLEIESAPGEPVIAESLFWPGHVRCSESLQVRHAVVGGVLEVHGDFLSRQPALLGSQPKISGTVHGVQPLVMEMQTTAHLRDAILSAGHETSSAPIVDLSGFVADKDGIGNPIKEEADRGETFGAS